MSRFGDYLRRQGLVTHEQLEQALQNQAAYGARLGTNLVELGVLRAEQLAEALSDFHKVPLPPRKWLARPQRAAVQRVSRPLVERIRFVPLRIQANVMHAAVMDPHDPSTIDDLRFATGCRIEAYVLPEIWMHDWLLALFKMPRGIREIEAPAAPDDPEFATGQTYDFDAAQVAQAAQAGAVPSVPSRISYDAGAGLAASGHPRASGRDFARGQAPTSQKPQVVPPPIPVEDAPNGTADGASVRPPQLTVQSLSELAAVIARPLADAPLASVAEPEPATTSFWAQRPVQVQRWSGQPPDESVVAETARRDAPRSDRAMLRRSRSGELAELETALLLAPDRERIVELSLSIASSFATAVALFSIQRGMIQGLRCTTRQDQAPAIDGVLVPVEAECMLAEAGSSLTPTRVGLNAQRVRPIDARVLRILGEEHAIEVALFPVVIKQRAVNLLYASHGNEPLGAIAFAALTALAERMAAAYEKLILTRKAADSAQ